MYPIEPIVIEHRLHQLGREHCGTLTRSVLPEGVTRQGYGERLMGETYDGIVVSDRYSGYGWLPVTQRQVCWAHLKRDFIRIAKRNGVSQAIGEGLLAAEKTLFHLWYPVRDGTLTHEALSMGYP